MKHLKLMRAGGVTAAVAAIVASSCCALPVLLGFLGANAGVVALLGPVQAFRPVFLVVAAVLIGLGWYVAVRKRATRTYLFLGAGTALLIVALAWPLWDAALKQLMLDPARRGN